jgi:hypothetical protein
MNGVQKFVLFASFEKARFTLFWYQMQVKLRSGDPRRRFLRGNPAAGFLLENC